MNLSDVRKRAFAMPLTQPAYPPGPSWFCDRESLILTSRTAPDTLHASDPILFTSMLTVSHVRASPALTPANRSPQVHPAMKLNAPCAA